MKNDNWNKDNIIEKIENRQLKIGIIGLGYVGLPLAIQFAEFGFKTIGFDVQTHKVAELNNGRSYIADVSDERLQNVINNSTFKVINNFELLKTVDFIAICVPTPLDEHQQPDISHIITAAKQIGSYVKGGTIIVLESTTYPGTTEEVVRPIIEKTSGYSCEKDIYLGFSPERVDPGNTHFFTGNTPKVVGGVGEEATSVIAAVYQSILESAVIEVSSPKVAEMEKLLENTYRHVNIGLVNEMAIICEKLGISVWEVIEAAKTKPYGFQAFYPGPGLGGHCIPLDPYYLSWKVKEYDYHPKLIEASGIVNDYMPEYIAQRISDILNRHKKPLNGSRILTLGVAYKQDIDDYRESPAIKVIEKLSQKGAIVQYYDPYISSYTHNGYTHNGLESLSKELLMSADLTLITTAHSNVNYNSVQRYSKVIFDTRNAMKLISERDNIHVL